MSLNREQATALAALEKYVSEQQDKLRRAVRRSVIIYLVLAVLIFCYTLFVLDRFKELTSQQELANYTRALMLDNLKASHDSLLAKYEVNADAWALKVVNETTARLPEVEHVLGAQYDPWADELASSVQENLVPDFTSFLKENAPALRAQYKNLSEEEAARGLAMIFADITEDQLNRQANQELIDRADSPEIALYEVSKPRLGLSRRQDAVRRLAAYSSFLSDHKRVHLELVNRFVDTFTNTVKDEWQLDFMDQLQLEALLNVKDVLPPPPPPARAGLPPPAPARP